MLTNLQHTEYMEITKAFREETARLMEIELIAAMERAKVLLNEKIAILSDFFLIQRDLYF